jgi:MEMO1 family protein
MEITRIATHAGSWYSDDPSTLDHQLSDWLRAAQVTEAGSKAVICPHAGYTYSGPTAAWGYCHIDPNQYTRVFIFGPSHHFYLSGCALPCSSLYSTPLGDLPVDTQITSSLESTSKFLRLTKSQEEDEHSLEMHLPYIRKIFQGKNIKIIPIMVGQMANEEEYSNIFIPYFSNKENLFVISSDFCHWGQRFRFNPYDQSCGEIYQSIEKMDKEGMDLIENHDVSGFKRYLERTRNTICGRNPIILLLSIISSSGLPIRTKFVKYSQSEQARKMSSSSVSYASSVSSLPI